MVPNLHLKKFISHQKFFVPIFIFYILVASFCTKLPYPLFMLMAIMIFVIFEVIAFIVHMIEEL